MSSSHTLLECRPFLYSNDIWTPQTVNAFRTHVRDLGVPRQEAAGIVVGAGGLPYILGHVSVGALGVIEIAEELGPQFVARTQSTLDHSSWEEFDAMVRDDDDDFDGQQKYLEPHLGLRGDFSTTQAAVRETEFFTHEGDIVGAIPFIAQELRRRKMRLVFANLTNVADYIAGHSGRCGQEILGEALAGLPGAEDAAILDSSFNPNLQVGVFTLEQYAKNAKQRSQALAAHGIQGNRL